MHKAGAKVADAPGGGQALPLLSPVDGKHHVFVRRSTPRPTWRNAPLPVRATVPQIPPPRRRAARPRPPLISISGQAIGAAAEDDHIQDISEEKIGFAIALSGSRWLSLPMRAAAAQKNDENYGANDRDQERSDTSEPIGEKCEHLD